MSISDLKVCDVDGIIVIVKLRCSWVYMCRTDTQPNRYLESMNTLLCEVRLPEGRLTMLQEGEEDDNVCSCEIMLMRLVHAVAIREELRCITHVWFFLQPPGHDNHTE